jgi:hypothetical protein
LQEFIIFRNLEINYYSDLVIDLNRKKIMEVERQHSGNVGRVVSSVRWLLSGQNYHLFLLLLKIWPVFWWMKKKIEIKFWCER